MGNFRHTSGQLAPDSLEYEKRGRIIREDAALRRRTAARVRQVLGAGGPAGAVSQRSGPQARAGEGTSRESVLKVIGWSKSPHSARNQGRYITRTRENDPESNQVGLETDSGAELRSAAEVDQEFASWQLLPAAANRSKAWQAAASEERQAMTANQALDRRQSVHLIFSLPAQVGASGAGVRATVRDGLAQTIGAAGHRYAFAVHTDHSARPHAHIVVKVQSEAVAGGRSRQLRLGPKELDHLRQVLTQEARVRGIDVQATRRVDRADIRAQLLQGRSLRENKSRGQLWREQSKQGAIFEAKAPSWYAIHGLAYERRRLAHFEGRGAEASATQPGADSSKRGLLSRLLSRRAGLQPAIDVPSVQQRPASPALERLDRRFAVTHRDAAAARESFLAMYQEAPRLAVWAANNHPSAFGEATNAKAPPLTGRGLKSLLQAAQSSLSHLPRASQADPSDRQELVEIRARTGQAIRTRRAALDSVEARRQIETLAQRHEKASGQDSGEAAGEAERLRRLAAAMGRKLTSKEVRAAALEGRRQRDGNRTRPELAPE